MNLASFCQKVERRKLQVVVLCLTISRRVDGLGVEHMWKAVRENWHDIHSRAVKRYLNNAATPGRCRQLLARVGGADRTIVHAPSK